LSISIRQIALGAKVAECAIREGRIGISVTKEIKVNSFIMKVFMRDTGKIARPTKKVIHSHPFG